MNAWTWRLPFIPLKLGCPSEKRPNEGAGPSSSAEEDPKNPRSKKERRPKAEEKYPPCPRELRYAFEERHANSYGNRKAGSDSSFYKEQNKRLRPSDLPFEMRRIKDAIRDAEKEGEKPQYRIQNVTQRNVCIHMTLGGHFFEDDHITESKRYPESYTKITEGETCYSHDAVWSNMSPRWNWPQAIAEKSRRIVRCNILLDPFHAERPLNSNANVVIDLKPVSNDYCEIEEGVTAYYADVILPRGEFWIEKVDMYTLQGNQSNARIQSVSSATSSVPLTYVTPWKKGEHWGEAPSADRYAAFFLTQGRDELEFERIFVDVTLRATNLVPFPKD